MFSWAKSKSKKDSSPSTKGKKTGKSSGGMEAAKPSDPRMLNIAAMDFGKFAYRNDKAYQEIKLYMEAYNASLEQSASTLGGKTHLAATKKLLDKCYNYIEANTTGEKEQHKGRCENVENVIFQISMAGNVLGRAQGNIDRMTADLDENDSGRTILKHLKEAAEGEGDSHYSKTMNMITANIMAQQDTTKYAASGASGASFHQKQEGDKLDYTHDVGARSDISTDAALTDSIGSTLHEFGHVNVSKLYGGNGMFIAAKQKDGQFADANEVSAESKRRIQEVHDLIKIGFDTKTSSQEKQDFKTSTGKFKGVGQNLDNLVGNTVADKDLDYALSQVKGYGIQGEQQRKKYVQNEKSNNLIKMYDAVAAKDSSLNEKGHGIYSDIDTDEKGKRLISWTTQFFDDHEKGMIDKTVGGQTRSLPGWVAKTGHNPQVELQDYFKDRTTEGSSINLTNVDENSEQAIINDFQQKLEQVGVSPEERAKYLNDIQMARTYNGALATGSFGSMIEYDPVITQALINYERNNPNDRSSQYYRKLKAMALRAHIRRLEQRLENEEGEVESMANDPYRNLGPSAKGSMVDRAYERRSAKLSSWATTH